MIKVCAPTIEMSAPSVPLIEDRPWPSSGSIRFFWMPPSSNGGSPILYYTLACASISYSEQITAPATTRTVTGLTNGVEHVFTLTATNANGTGPAATFISVQPGVLPFGPSTITASTLNASTALITWNLSTIANEGTPKWFVVTVLPSTQSISSYTKSAYIFERARTFQMPSTNIAYQFLVQAINDTGYCRPFAYTSSLQFILNPAFSPSNLNGLSFWIDATQITGASNNQALTAWNDLSPNAYAGGASNGPTYITSGIGGNPSVRFNGSTQYINYGTSTMNIGTNPWHTFMVVKYSTINTLGTLMAKALSGGATNRYYLGKLGATTLNDFFLEIGSGTVYQANVSFNTTSTTLLGYYWDRATMFNTINGSTISTLSLVSSVNHTNPYNFLIGAYNNASGGVPPFAGYYFPGDMGEIVSYLAPLTPYERQKMEGYLGWKWGLQSNLPTIHPFRFSTPVAASVFSPSSFAGLHLWIDATDTSSFTVVPGTSSISTIRDKSSNAYLFTGASSFVYAKNFNGNYPSFSNDSQGGGRLGFNNSFFVSSPLTTFFVLQISTTGLYFIYDTIVGDRIIYYTDSSTGKSGNIASIVGGNLTEISVAGTNINTTNQVVTALYNGANSAGFINGSNAYTTGNVSSGTFSSLSIGYSARFNNYAMRGQLCELLMYRSPLSLDNRQTVEGYLAWKWGIQGSLASNHPYKYTSPTYLNPLVAQSSLQLWLDANSYSGSGDWLDLSPFQRHAGLENGTRTKNAAGNGIVFNGATNYSTTGSVMSSMNNWTASFWFKRTSTVITNGQAGCILTEIHSGASINLIVLADSTAAPGTSPSSFTGAFVTQPGDTFRTYAPAYQPTSNQWMNGTYTYDGTNMRFYVNGSLSGTTNIGATSVGNSNRYRIGRRWDLANYIVGEIGQILIYNRALTSNEIGSNYSAYSNVFSV